VLVVASPLNEDLIIGGFALAVLGEKLGGVYLVLGFIDI